jgi:UDP-2,3-diacylglucosamine hydrolase
MNEKPSLVVSDIHLGAVPDSTERMFRRFLEHASEHAAELLINGDLFDFWFEYRTVIPSRYYRVLAALADTVESGVPVAFTSGNHDAWGGAFLRDSVGLRLIDGAVTEQWAGRRVLIAHGDGVGAGDRRYRALRRVIRNPWVVRAFRALHPDLGSRIALRASSTETKAHDGGGEGQGRADHIERWATEQIRRDPSLELVLAGHAHVPCVREVAPGRYYANSGDWIHHFSYLELPAGGGAPLLRRWPGTPGAA